MKSSEVIRWIERNGWQRIRQSGSHIIFEKDGKIYPVPNHGSKEMGFGLVMKIRKEMNLR